MIIEKIQRLANKYHNEIIDIRRHLHQNPELSFQESETAKYIIEILEKWGIEYQSGIAGNGIIAILKGIDSECKTIALRADIDALPIEELNDIEYKSSNRGVMHACGHDAHTASLLGVIRIFKDIEFKGTIKFIFQPAEEKLPGGAKQMIDEGILKSTPIPELIIGQHVYPELPAGKVGFKVGPYMASNDEIYITVKGKGGHGAMPEKITNTVLIASKILVELQQIPNDLAPKNIKTVLTFGKVIANGATNVVPNEVYIEGTFRTFDEDWRIKAHEYIHSISENIAKNMGGSVEINIKGGYPVLNNNEEITNKSILFAKEYLGADNVETLNYRMTSEDFAFFSQELPATFYRLGTSKPGDININPLHSPHFNIDENSLITGMGTMSYIAYNLLEDK